MLNIGLQFFAHKKGVGSTRNGRDSESKRLGVKRGDGQFVLPATSWSGSAAPYPPRRERGQGQRRHPVRPQVRQGEV